MSMHPHFQYPTKFVCGKSDGKVAAPGHYWTAINVHNPGIGPVVLQKKFVQALPNETPGGLISRPDRKDLGPDEAFEIDCGDISKRFEDLGLQGVPFLKGFVVIESDMELDVVAV